MIRALVFVIACGTAFSQDIMPTGKTITELWNFYRQPSYTLLTNIILSIDVDPNFRTDKEAQTTLMAFFAVAIERYPEKFNSLNALSDSLKNVKKLLREALALSRKKDAILNWRVHKPVTIGVLWSGYFASGEPRYLKRLISEMSLCDRNDSIVVTETGFGAKLTLSMYARMFPEIKQYLEEALGSSSANLSPHIHDAIYLSPRQIAERMKERAEGYKSREK